MSKKDLKKGDEVVVIAGSEKGKRGTISEIVVTNPITKRGRYYPAQERVVITGINIAKHHEKKRGAEEAGIYEREAPVHRSNVVLASAYDARKADAGKK
ncbi:MAG: 50S ribosomal protein L24 [Puniceicoccales bacterium]|jgi:large subunit ribosomal protein L24|nr:50S ribosomal protein L24 [Puniceicoccales bacterium]